MWNVVFVDRFITIQGIINAIMHLRAALAR